MERRILLIALFFVIITKVIFSQGIDIKVNCPPNVQQGQEFEMKITITKGDVSGFARLQIDFPEGFTVKTTQALGATFSYKENKARFLWMSIPAEKEISVNCMVTAAASVTGKQEFEGTFSFVVNNETQRTTIAKQSFIVEGTGLLAQKDTKTETIEVNKTGDKSTEDAEKLEGERKAREVAIAKAEKEKKERDEQEKRLKEEAAQKAREDALAQEEAEKNANNNKVTNNVDNGSKDQEKIDQERKAKEEADAIAEEQKIAKQKEAEKIEQENKAKEGNASMTDEEKAAKQKDAEKIEQERKAKEEAIASAEKEKKAREAEEAKLAQIQKDEEIKTEETNKTIETNKTSESNKTSEINKTTEDNKDAEKIEMERKAKEDAIAKIEAERKAKEDADRLEREKYAKEMALKSKETENKTANKTENKTTIKTENKSENKTVNKTVDSNINKASINNSVDFRVQVGASRKIADRNEYYKLSKGISEFKVVQNDGADGWYRYTVGSFTDVASAQKLLPKVKQLGYEGFVVAFKDGKRITIQEAKKMLGQ